MIKTFWQILYLASILHHGFLQIGHAFLKLPLSYVCDNHDRYEDQGHQSQLPAEHEGDHQSSSDCDDSFHHLAQLGPCGLGTERILVSYLPTFAPKCPRVRLFVCACGHEGLSKH